MFLQMDSILRSLVFPPSHRASWRFPPHHAERHSFVFLKLSGTASQNLTARTKTKLRCGGSFGEMFHWRNLPGEICQRNLPAKFAAELVGELFGEKMLVKPNLIFGEKPPKTFHCKLHHSQNVPSTHPKNPARLL